MNDLRTPPQSLEAEKHVLGAMLLSRDAALSALEILGPEDFYLHRNQLIFEAIREISGQNSTPDALSVLEFLKKKGKSAEIEQDLMEISSEVFSVASVSEHAAIVREKATLRALIGFGTEVTLYGYSDKDAATGLEMALNRILQIDRHDRGGGLKDWRDGVREAVGRWAGIVAGENQGVMSGIMDYDQIIGGFLPSQLHVIAGRPGMGKSALTLQLAKAGGKVALYSLESLMFEQVERAVSQEVGVPSFVFRSGESLTKHRALIDQAVSAIKNFPIKVNETTTVNVQQIHSQCRKMKMKDGLDMVIVDYLQLVQAVGKHERREREIGSISESLKRMANDLAVPVIAVASLSRDCERREDKRPILSDLRESGSIESDAHTVTFLYRESNYKRNLPVDFQDVTEICVAKNKNGPKGIAPVLFEGKRFRFVDLDRDTKQRYKDHLGGKSSESFMEGVK